jgi:hypothetical protein
VLAEVSLRTALWPRLLAVARALPARVADRDRQRWARLCAAIDRDEAAAALADLAQLERLTGVTT